MTIEAPLDSSPTKGTQASSSMDAPARRADAAGDAEPVAGVFDPSWAMRWLLAALSWGAAAVHLAMVPQHAEASFGTGLAFAAAGWFQFAFGVAIIARPRRWWVRAGIAANVGLIAAWAWSRTVGLPTWTGDGGVEPVSAVDGFCVALEVGLVCAAVVLLIAPNALGNVGSPALVVASSIPIGILVATTAVIASPDAANHTHGGTDHHELETAAAADAQPGEHSHGGTEADGADARHHGESSVSYADLEPETRAEVDQVIAAWERRYPTGADATSAGWFKATPNLYGIGAHYIRNVNGFSVAEPFDMLNPNILLYDGEGPDAKFAGVSYVVSGDVEGFAGDHDFWHAHESVCMKDGKISLTEEDSRYWYSELECNANGGRVMPIAADRMMHLWIGPGYTDAPIFAHDNSAIYDGYYPKQPS